MRDTDSMKFVYFKALTKILFKSFEIISKKNSALVELKNQNLLYKPKKYLTNSALNYFRTLEEKYGAQYYIIPQVPVSSIADIELHSRYFEYKGYQSKDNEKTFDFVLFDKLSFVPVLVIEIDDYTHGFLESVERDRSVNAVMEKIGIKIERVKSEKL